MVIDYEQQLSKYNNYTVIKAFFRGKFVTTNVTKKDLSWVAVVYNHKFS
jgi:hypothetical protein